MATDQNFRVKNGLEVGGQEVISSSGVITSAALGGQTLGTTDSPTFANATLTGSLRGPSTFTIDPAAVGDNTGTLVIAGNLQVDGTTTTINSTTMEVDDLNITLASGAANAAAANGAGITVDGASATITYDGTNDEWDFNKPLDVTGAVTADGLTVDGAGAKYIRVGSTDGLGAKIFLDGSSNGDFLGGDYSIIQNSGTKFQILGGTPNAPIEIQTHDGSGNKLRQNIASNGDISFYEDTGTTAKFIWSAANERLTLKTTGAIALDVQASATTSATIATFSNSNGSDKAGFRLDTQGDGELVLIDAGNNEDVVITAGGNTYFNGGNVGIGTTSPDSKLHVVSSTDDILTVQNSTYQGSGQNTEAGIRFKVTASADDERAKAGILFKNDGSAYGRGDLHFLVDSNDDNGNVVLADAKMTITHEGNVGIGTTDPNLPLTITSNSGANAIAVRARSNDDYSFVQFYNNAGTALRGQIYNHNGNIGFTTGTDSSAGNDLYIKDGGNVGIGTTSPNFMLHINKGTSSYAPTSGVNENVFGINTSYDAAGTQGVTLSRLDGNWVDGTTGADSAYGWLWGYQNYVRGGLVYDHRGSERMQLFSSYGALAFITPDAADGNGVPTDSNMVERLTILPGGNVGIGTSNPSATEKLTVRRNSNNLRLETENDPTNYYAIIGANYNYGQAFDIKVKGAGAEAHILKWADGNGVELNSGYATTKAKVVGDVEIVQTDKTHTLNHSGGTDIGYKFNLGFIRGGSGGYNHIKTNLPSNGDRMMKFEYDGWTYSGTNYHESVTFYTYSGQTGSPYNISYVDWGTGGGIANVYYSSDNYVVIVIQAHVSYTGGFLYAQCGRGHYVSDIQILATGSNSTTSGVF